MDSAQDYSHIIIGAGSAGCILASRITENPNFNVLLLEAGPDCDGSEQPNGSHNSRRVPMKGQNNTYDETIDWNVRVDLPDGGAMNVAQAKLVGGGSSINGGTALRNTPHDSMEWMGLGNDSWGWESVQPVYAALEEDEVKGTKGLHPLTRIPFEDAGAIQKAFVQGSLQSGLDWVDDLNGTEAEGVGASPVCRRGDRRISTAVTFLSSTRQRKNFHLMTGCLVDRVLFTGNRATGVLLANGRRVSANAEVIVSAGALFSPAVLQRSGVGPSSLLSSIGVPVRQDLPVGEALADHCCIPVTARPKPGAYVDDDFSLQMQARLSSVTSPGFMDLQLVCFSYLYTTSAVHSQAQRSLGGSETGHVAGIGCNVNKPTSSGVVRIISCNANDQPYIAPNYLSTASDRARAREAVRLANRVIQSEAMQTVLSPPFGLTTEIIASDDLLDDWIQSQYASTYHFTSTCRMAGREHGGVVDQSGRVYGIQSLRVADASVIPTIPAANTMWSTCMFAERIARSVRDGKPVERIDARL